MYGRHAWHSRGHILVYSVGVAEALRSSSAAIYASVKNVPLVTTPATITCATELINCGWAQCKVIWAVEGGMRIFSFLRHVRLRRQHDIDTMSPIEKPRPFR